jgi:hypothetical protein
MNADIAIIILIERSFDLSLLLPKQSIYLFINYIIDNKNDFDVRLAPTTLSFTPFYTFDERPY